MSGGTPEHSIISVNLFRLLGSALVAKPCCVFASNMRIKVNANDLYTYPDASIACPPLEYDEELSPKSLTNPQVIMEILSDSTASYDRGGKFNLYRGLSSLREYFLISQDAAVVERRSKTGDGEWSIQVADGLKSNIRVETIAYTLNLNELYDKIDFPPRFVD